MTCPIPPTVDYLKEVATKGKLELSEGQLEEYKEVIASFLPNYERLEQLTEKKPVQKYPRTAGYRPQPEENPYNGWWYKTDIPGATEGKLKGKRVAIKDNMFVAGVPLLNGCHLMNGYIPEEDATVVTRILDQGGHIVGKTNCENLCFSGSSLTCAAGPVLNPWDKTRTTGGSSSGNGAVLQLGEADMAIGGDQGGSIRIPASWCGIVGLKPTHGLVPYTGIIAIEGTVDHTGPMARTVTDCALLLEVIAGSDGEDFRQPTDIKVPEYTKFLDGKVSGMKVGVLVEGMASCEEDVVSVVRSACKQFKTLGVDVEEVSIPQHEDAYAMWFPRCVEGAYKTLQVDAGAINSVRGHQNVECVEHLARGMATRARELPPSLKLLYLLGNFIQDNYGSRYYLKSTNLLPECVKAYDKALEKYDVLVMPTLPYKAPKLLDKGYSLKDYFSHCFGMCKNTAAFDITGHPALSLNVGQVEGLPVGMQFVGRHWDETSVLRLAYAMEQQLA